MSWTIWQFLSLMSHRNSLSRASQSSVQGHSAKSWEWETPAKNLQSCVAIPSSEIPLFSDLLEFVGSLSGVVGSCWELLGVFGTCREFVRTHRECHLAKPS